MFYNDVWNRNCGTWKAWFLRWSPLHKSPGHVMLFCRWISRYHVMSCLWKIWVSLTFLWFKMDNWITPPTNCGWMDDLQFPYIFLFFFHYLFFVANLDRINPSTSFWHLWFCSVLNKHLNDMETQGLRAHHPSLLRGHLEASAWGQTQSLKPNLQGSSVGNNGISVYRWMDTLGVAPFKK